MFSPDVVSLRQFYATPMGEQVRVLIARGLYHLWPELRGDTVLGIGFATPYLDYLGPGTPSLACMPAAQGAIYWPPSKENRTFLSHESELPLPENSINRVLLVHSIENSEELSGMMREVWRVLTPGGRVLVIVPNRLGLWSRSPRSPFGYGRPFSMAQLKGLLSEHQFTPTRQRAALFTPPTRLSLIWRAAGRLEKIGHTLCWFLGGVLMIEAEKQVYAAIRQPVEARSRQRVPVTAAKPAMSRQ